MATGGTKIYTSEDVHDEIKESDLHCVKYCDACKYDGSHEEATGFCVQCAEYLCELCFRGHRKNKTTRKHTLLNQDEMPANKDTFETINKLTKCNVHPHHDYAYECVEHKSFICVVCLSETHRKCDDILDLSACREIDQAHLRMCAEIQEQLEDLTSKTECSAKEIGNKVKKVEGEIMSFGAQLKQNIDVLTDKLMAEIKDVINAEIENNIEARGDCKQIQTNIETGIQLLETIKAYGTKQQIAILARHTKSMHENITNEISKFNVKKQQFTLTFSKDSTLQETKSIGKVQLLALADDDTTCDSDALTNEDFTYTPLIDRCFRQCSMIHNVRSRSDKSVCSVSSIRLLKNGHIVLADCANLKIKLFSNKFDYIDDIQLPKQPIDMCNIDNEIYVCCENMKRIYHIVVKGNKLFLHMRSYVTGKQPICVSEFDSELIVLFGKHKLGEGGNVNIENRNGCSIRSRITYDSSDKDLKGIKDAKKIISLKSTKILLTENDRVTCYEIDQTKCKIVKRRWYYRISYGKNILEGALGLTKDSEGNVYVCGYNSNNVHQVSSHNFCMNQVVVPYIERPVSVCVDEQNDRLLVGCEEDDYVHSYSIM